MATYGPPMVKRGFHTKVCPESFDLSQHMCLPERSFITLGKELFAIPKSRKGRGKSCIQKIKPGFFKRDVLPVCLGSAFPCNQHPMESLAMRLIGDSIALGIHMHTICITHA